MKIKKGLELRNVAGEQIIVPTGAENVNFSHLISLNSSAAFLWEKLEKMGGEFEAATLVDLLLENYEVSKELASNDVNNLIESWKEAGIII